MRKIPAPIGTRFGLYTVLSEAESPNGKTKWLCQCDCGTIRSVYQLNLVRRPNGSCGCLSKQRISKLNLSHGLSNTPEYNIWMTMKARCYNPNNEKYKNYGGRGIKICKEWLNDFNRFISDMGERPSLKHSIDRKNVDGDYEPINCKWVTNTEQNRNRRNNHLIETPWGFITLAEAAEKAEIKYATLKRRVKVGFTGIDLFSKNKLKRTK